MYLNALINLFHFLSSPPFILENKPIINWKEMFSLFNADANLANKILLNVIKDLSRKMRKDNTQLEELLYRVRALDSL